MYGIQLGDAVNAAVASASVPKPSVWDNINNVLNVAQKGANIYTQVKQPNSPGVQQPSGSASLPYQVPGGSALPPTPTPAPDNTKKYLLIGGAVVLGATGIYFATRKKGKK